MRRIALILSIALILGACNEEFLDTVPRTQKVDANFYQTPEDAHMALTAIYNTLPAVYPHSSIFFTSELMSDHRFGGGRIHNETFNAVNMFKKNDPNQYLPAWETYYQGVFRVNMLINRFDQIQWDNEDRKNQALGEAHFLRAYIYFNLARMFERVPLVLEPVAENLPQAEPDVLYAQIAEDFKKAIEVMPSTSLADMNLDERLGHATKWAAQGMMARAFLFYTGFYNKDAMPLPDGGEVTKTQVIDWLDDCIDNSDHALIDDFRNLWPYAYANEDYGYAKEHSLDWVGEEGANTETVFAYKFSNYGSHETSVYYSNQIVLYFGMRGQSNIPIGQGWGAGTVNPQLWESWPDEDPRKQGSILNVNPDWGDTELDWISDYQWGGTDQWQEAGMWQKKYIPINVLDEEGNEVGYSVHKYGTESDYQLQNTQDLVILRFADILLMAAELKEDAAPLNIVRARSGLNPVDYSLENIQKERAWELAFEGIRYFDIQRWGIAEQEFAKVKDVPVYDATNPSTTTIVYRPDTRGFLHIPQTEIDKSEGVLQQNPGWETSEAEF